MLKISRLPESLRGVKIATLVVQKVISRYFNLYFSKNRPVRQNSPLFSSNPRKVIKLRYIILILLALFVLGFGIKNINYISPKSSLYEGIVGSFTEDNLPIVVTSLLSDPLIEIDKTGKPKPVLLTGWQTNNDATVYTLKLKPDLIWNDGTKVNSSDIEVNIPDVSISYPDDQTIEFKLIDSFGAFPSLLNSPVFKKGTLVGTGKYVVKGKTKTHGLISQLVLNPVESEDMSLPNIFVKFYPEEKTAKTALSLGEVDSLIGINDISEFSNIPSLKVMRVISYNKFVAVFYNTKDPILSDRIFRKALNSSIPQIEGEEKAVTSIPSHSWFFNDTIPDLTSDLKLAKQHLAKVEKGKDSTITLTTTHYLSKTGEKIIQNWKEVGIKAVLRIESGVPQNFQALLIAQPILSDPDQYPLWHSTESKTNVSKYDSQRADKDLEDGRKISDLEKRKERYLDLQKVLSDDVPASFLYFPKTNVVYRKKYEDILNQVLPLQSPN
ncbi:MAG: ABC transporter substrate-binding protein [Candidatus Daviesbacteria bacterium]|nr:ABC transporter substrate-binding protein [Candidatus Daviesbacteria bacterium]